MVYHVACGEVIQDGPDLLRLWECPRLPSLMGCLCTCSHVVHPNGVSIQPLARALLDPLLRCFLETEISQIDKPTHASQTSNIMI